MKKINLFIITFLFFCFPVKADFVNLIRADKCETIIEVFIEDYQIRVTFEVGLKDWKYFKEIIPIELLNEDVKKIIRSQSKNYFYNKVFTLNADGVNLIGEIVKQEIMPRKYRASLYTGVVDENNDVSKQILFVEIIYPINYKAKKIILTPPMEEGLRGTRANIGFVSYHKKIPVNDLRYLSQASTMNLNWEDPWYTKFNNLNLRRHHQSSLMSFLYVDPYEVRHEVLMRVKDLEEWMDLGYKLDDYIEIDEQDALKQKIAQFLKSRNIVTIDGKVRDPIIDKIHFVKWSLAGIQIQEIKERMDYSSAVIGIIFAYPHDSIAQKISIKWDMFSEKILAVPNVATDPAGPMPYTLMEDDNVLVWTNYLKKYKLPTIIEMEVTSVKFPFLHLFAILALFYGVIRLIKNKRKVLKYGPALLLGFLLFVLGNYFTQSFTIPFIQQTSFSKPEATNLISQLLKNTYRAFDFREESSIYDKLAVSNVGELLSEVYIQTKKEMVLKSQGGIQVKVKDVELLEVEEINTEKEDLAYHVKWIVSGDVGHWGHIHSRINQYSANLSIKAVDGVWKLSGIEITEEIRL